MSRPLQVRVDELALAYRKAKVDLFYSNDQRPLDLLRYEEDLASNLSDLARRLNGQSEQWANHPDFLGDCVVLPKGIKSNGPENTDSTIVHSSPLAEWEAATSNKAERPKAQFRLFSRCSIDMHILGALWIGRVGAVLDQRLSDTVRGYRLRRNEDGDYNWYSSGSFEPYLRPFRQWRDDGFDAMTAALDEGVPVVALTADVESFFPHIDARFLSSDDAFLKDVLGVELNPADTKLHRLFLKAMAGWKKHISGLLDTEVTGLPLGFPPSSIVANLAMIEFDQRIETAVRPRYYGRYVDDIILVLTGVKGLNSAEDAWKFLSEMFNLNSGTSMLELENGGACRYRAEYLKDSSIRFANDKNKVFLLELGTGTDVIRSLRATISERASEWRMLPVLPANASDVGPSVARATAVDGGAADSLRATDKISAGRAGFALTLRDFEAHARDLDPESWADHRRAFLSAVRDHILVPPVALEMDQYISRVLKFAIDCGDWEEFFLLAGALTRVHELVASTCDFELKSTDGSDGASQGVGPRWAAHIRSQIVEAIATTAASGLSKAVHNQIKAVHKQIDNLTSQPLLAPDASARPSDVGKALYRRLFTHDLAYQPFRLSLLPYELRSGARAIHRGDPFDVDQSFVPKALRGPLGKLALALVNVADVPAALQREQLERHIALVFPTRPLGTAELFALTRVLSPLTDTSPVDFNPWLFATRGYSVETDLDTPIIAKDKDGARWIITLPRNAEGASVPARPRVAITMFDTSDQEWAASVHQRPDLSMTRWNTLATLANDVLGLPDRPDYLVLGELAVPSSWFQVIARKLAAHGVSLIAGVEYLHAHPGIVRNQVWFSVVHDALGFTSAAIYRQDKQRAAHGERRKLASHAGLTVKAAIQWTVPPLIHHGDLWMAMLVCSELTNIEYRASLRGKVDFLVVPEWNQDLNTFEPLVESAALDLHSYVVQVNTRHYGDSRVRSPRENVWERDLARVKGGRNDYVVVVDIDTKALRSFQSQLSATSGGFKPLPDGFDLAESRRIVPDAKLERGVT